MLKNSEVILVIDDQPSILEYIKLILEAIGYRVLTASDGIAALAVLHDNQVDLILADIAMPNMNGYQLYEKVRERPDWLTIPFIFVTARAMDSDVRYGKELGVDDYLTKPIQPEDIMSIVQGKLKRAKQLSHAIDKTTQHVENSTDIIDVGNLHLDPQQYQAWIGDRPIDLSTTEFKMLEYLACRSENTIPHEEIIQVTHDLDMDRAEAGSLLRPLVRSIRRKMGYEAGNMGCIKSVRGVGYMVVPPGDE